MEKLAFEFAIKLKEFDRVVCEIIEEILFLELCIKKTYIIKNYYGQVRGDL